MKELQSLELHELTIDDGFFAALPDLAPQSQVCYLWIYIIHSLYQYVIYVDVS